MSTFENSQIVILFENIKTYYKNSSIYRGIDKLEESIANSFKNSVLFGCTNHEERYYEESVTYRVIINLYQFKCKMFKTFLKMIEGSLIISACKTIMKGLSNIFNEFWKIYIHSFIYHTYLDWIEDETI